MPRRPTGSTDAAMSAAGRATSRRCSPGRCRSSGRTGGRRRCCRCCWWCRSCSARAQPWPLKLDHRQRPRQRRSIPSPSRGAAGSSRSPATTWSSCSILIVVGGVLLQVVNQFVTAYATQIQVDAGQRMVYDLRGAPVRASPGARDCSITSRRIPATRCIASTSTPIRSKTW